MQAKSRFTADSDAAGYSLNVISHIIGCLSIVLHNNRWKN
jgi:hypothetical protein